MAETFLGKAVPNPRLLFHFCGCGGQVVLPSLPLQPGSHRPLFYLHTPAGRAHPFPGSSSPGWQALEGLKTPQVQGKRDLISLAPLLVLDRHGLHTHTHTYFSASRPNAGPLVPEIYLLGEPAVRRRRWGGQRAAGGDPGGSLGTAQSGQR